MADWKALLKSITPTIATALGGPLAGVATQVLSKALFDRDDGTEEELKAVLTQPDPDTLLKVKEADQAFTAKMEELGIKLEEVHAADRKDARAREVALKDHTTKILAGLITSEGTPSANILPSLTRSSRSQYCAARFRS